MFLAGKMGVGKTFLSTMVVSKSVGGHSDGGKFLTSSSDFNKEVFSTGLCCVDDGIAASDSRGRQRMTEFLKRMVANEGHNYRAMYADDVPILWSGRVIATLNDDPSSLQSLPNLDDSILDKIVVLRMLPEPAVEFMQTPSENEALVSRELPFLLRWLLDWVPPADMRGTARFGFRGYMNREIRDAAIATSEVGDILEIIDIWKKSAREVLKSDYWEGTAAEFLQEINQYPDIAPLCRTMTPRSLGRKFSQASKNDAAKRIQCAKESHKGNGNRYRIPFSETHGSSRNLFSEESL